MTARPAFAQAVPVPDIGAPGPRGRRAWPATMQTCIGLGCLALLLLGTGGWAATTRIAGAIIAFGVMELDGHRHILQHTDGGAVAEIFVRNGDLVAAGDVLMRLETHDLQTDLDILRDERTTLAVRSARLLAERDGRRDLTLQSDLAPPAATTGDLRDMFQAEQDLHRTRMRAHRQALDQLSRREQQIGAQMAGVTAQRAAVVHQLSLLRQDIDAQQRLLDRGLTLANRVLALRREETVLIGQEAELAALTAGLHERAAEIALQILRTRTQTREAAISQLSDLALRRAAMSHRLNALMARMDARTIRAPIAGTIHDLRVPGPGSIVPAAGPILTLVARDRPAIVRARIPAQDIDAVSPGQTVTLRLVANDARPTADLGGYVRTISAESFVSDTSGARFYDIIIAIEPNPSAPPDGSAFRPGMPVEAHIRLPDRTAIDFLTRPLSDYFVRAFREG